nr:MULTISPECIES: hypothetical protein [Brasilonema]
MRSIDAASKANCWAKSAWRSRDITCVNAVSGLSPSFWQAIAQGADALGVSHPMPN